MSDALRRALRTLIQVVIANLCIALLAVIAQWNTNPAHIPSWGEIGKAWWWVLLTILPPVIAFIQNNLEDLIPAFPALLKSPPSPGQHPVPAASGPPQPPPPAVR